MTRGQFDGWEDSPGIKGDNIARPDADGDYDLPIENEARWVNIGGILTSTSRQLLMSGGDALKGRMAGRFQVENVLGVRWAESKRASPVKFVAINNFMATWQVRLKFDESTKYGDTRTWVASVGANAGGIFHKGNYNAFPKFTVAGAMPGGYRLTIMGQVFNVTQPLISGQPHSIEYSSGRLRIGGNVVHGGVGYGFTPYVPPGAITALSIVPGTTGTATATLSLTDTYI
ncbi:hypothetical protein [Paenarthrobacter sp. A20]|uniref:hypothetical protein n=1 Tax=Paenarthrobacter sp. A20 TaxID=2817891 RepID=UPI00209FCFDB|nr:hypothetical protein [Paenarthrobacter sp. A20]MCP1414410.1 hypothetical protein [Paenarthrobacter sp. A20]